MLNGHGDDIYAFGKEAILYNFSSNVCATGTPPKLIEHITQHIDVIQHYPSPIAEDLLPYIAEHFDIDKRCCLISNGATESIYLIAQYFKTKCANIVIPTFSEYEDACTIFDIDINYISVGDLDTVQTLGDVLFICNPNNPDGKYIQPQHIESLLQAFPNTHFVIDESYIECISNGRSLVSVLYVYDNLSVIRSLTKTFAIPGIRLGYILSSPKIIQSLYAIQRPWTVNSLAIEAGKYIFSNYQDVLFDTAHTVKRTHIFKQQINAITYLECVPNETTYFLVKLHKKTAKALKQYLIQAHRILVRDATNFKGLEGEYIRLSVQSDEANMACIKALKQWK